MLKKTDEVKVLRDPIHGYIHVEYQVIWDCINSKWFQRLRRIRQLGGAFMVYHTADHTRFGHSLGVYEIVRRMIYEVNDINAALNETEKVTAMLAGLLHDIGHGPYSHAFESVTNHSHEEYTCRIINENPELHAILENAKKGLSKQVVDVIMHRSSNPILPQLVSSQLDADRMDYLLRDAYFTGTKYGEFDLERILRTLRVQDNKIVVKESGIFAIENYIMARYHMYWQIYYHPVARSYEVLLKYIFLRMQDLAKIGQLPEVIPAFSTLAHGGNLTLEEYYQLDEYSCAYGFSQLIHCNDAILQDLAGRITNRYLFDYQENTNANVKKVQKQLKKYHLDERYYFAKDEVDQRPYIPYTVKKEGIWIRMHGGKIFELSSASNIVQSLIKGKINKDDRIYYPAHIFEK